MKKTKKLVASKRDIAHRNPYILAQLRGEIKFKENRGKEANPKYSRKVKHRKDV